MTASLDASVRAAASGDEAAFARLLQQLVPVWRRVAGRLLDDDAAAIDDAIQETALRVFRGLHRFDGRADVRTWSYRILVNACTDQRRQSLRWQRVQESPMHSGHVMPRDVLAAIDVTRALAQLPADLRTLLALRYEADLSFQQIATALELPIGTVSTRMRRALALLGTALHVTEA